MPRKLPWKLNSTTTTVSRKRVVTSKISTHKRQRRDKVASEGDGDSEQQVVNKDEQLSSSSPPPEPPIESLMKEGMDNDDKYRMVEDEFLTVAQRFTMHLHAAEYKRQQNLAKNRNAASISSISRPVAGKMPDHTRRKVEAVARAKSQKVAVESLKQSDHSDDSDDGGELPYVGTTLHGLMESPRKNTTSLAKAGTIATTTRAAAGFKKPTVAKPEQNIMAYSTQQKKPSKSVLKYESDGLTASFDNGDDLDGPIPTPKLALFPRKASTFPQVNRIKSEPSASNSTLANRAARPSSPMGYKRLSKTEATTSDADDLDSRISRLEQIRRRRAKPEKKQQSTDGFGSIPTFL